MEAKELRIGNLFYFPFTGEKIEVLGINAHEYSEGIYNTISFKKGTNLYCEKIEVLKPILLTEEWHNKFEVVKNGFNQFEYNCPTKNNFNVAIIFVGDYVYIRQREDKNKPSLSDDLISIWNKDLTKRDMYVHEWQNLYFALTGEELTIKK